MHWFRGDDNVAHAAFGACDVVGRWWFDDSGGAWPAYAIGADVLARRRAFAHLGMAEFVSSPSAVRLSWDVTSVAVESLLAAAGALALRPASTDVTLKYFWGGWNTEVSLRPAAALARIAMLKPYRDAAPFSGVMVERRPLSSVRDEGALIQAAFEAWDRKGSFFAAVRCDERDLSTFAHDALGFRPNARESDLLFDHIGGASGAVRVFGNDWAETAVGRICHRTQPDFEFDDRVCEPYAAVLTSGEPWVDHVRAAIRRDGGDPVWVPYRRLVIPTRDRFGAPMVMSLCDVRQDVAIPFMAA